MLKAKIHRARVTRADLNYEGSITVDSNLLERAGILPNEQVDVLNITNGERFTTYAIEGQAGSGEIGVNGAAARLVQEDDLVIICAYCGVEEDKAPAHEPKIVLIGDNNKVAN